MTQDNFFSNRSSSFRILSYAPYRWTATARITVGTCNRTAVFQEKPVVPNPIAGRKHRCLDDQSRPGPAPPVQEPVAKNCFLLPNPLHVVKELEKHDPGDHYTFLVDRVWHYSRPTSSRRVSRPRRYAWKTHTFYRSTAPSAPAACWLMDQLSLVEIGRRCVDHYQRRHLDPMIRNTMKKLTSGNNSSFGWRRWSSLVTVVTGSLLTLLATYIGYSVELLEYRKQFNHDAQTRSTCGVISSLEYPIRRSAANNATSLMGRSVVRPLGNTYVPFPVIGCSSLSIATACLQSGTM